MMSSFAHHQRSVEERKRFRRIEGEHRSGFPKSKALLSEKGFQQETEVDSVLLDR